MTNSIWPRDTYLEPDVPITSQGISTIDCFVAMPSRPRDRWDDFFALIQDICNNLSGQYNIPIRPRRAIDIVSSGVIHPEIWEAIKRAHIVISDVTGHNGNVILELGVAAAWKRKENVIILREKSDEKEHLFDIMPARHLEYELSYHGLSKLANDLSSVIMDCVATYPFSEPSIPPVPLPFQADLTDGKDVRDLYTPDVTHRRMLSDCLEFGSPLDYRYSWMTVGNLEIPNVHVQADLKMTLDGPNQDHFMGVMVRGLSFFSNYGHFVIVRPDGRVFLVERQVDGNGRDVQLDTIPGYDMHQFTHFDISVDVTSIKIAVNDKGATKKLTDLPYVFSNGRVIFIGGWGRVGLRKVRVEAL